MTFKNFVSPHIHQGSLDTGAVPKDFIKRELELGTGYTTCTDHGSLRVTRQVYDLALENKIKPILGLEAYVRDDNCPILTRSGIPKNSQGEFVEYAKYFHLTLHTLDQAAYEAVIRLLSHADLNRSERYGSERKPIFTWSDVETLGTYNVTMTSSCLVGMIQRHLVDRNNPEMAIAYYEKLRSCVKPGNFYVEVFPHVCDHFWQAAGILTWDDGTTERVPPWRQIKTEKHGKGKVKELADVLRCDSEEVLVVATMQNRQWVDQAPRRLVKLEYTEGFLQNECRPWLQSPDLQRGANEFVLNLAQQYGDKILVSDDSHFAVPGQKIVQDIRLQSSGGTWRFYGSYHRQTSEEAWKYFQQHLPVVKLTYFESWIENSYEWAARFNDFKLVPRTGLPTRFYPEDTFSHTMSIIDRVGRMRWNNEVYVQRLHQEMELLYENGVMDMLPYFMVDEEVVRFFAEMGELTGPGRGSAAGLLLAYLLGITHVDPIRYTLSVDRFMTLTRIKSKKMPDIDQDLPCSKRHLLIDPVNGWLRKRFGDCYAHISVDTKLRLRSAVKDVARVQYGKVPEIVENLAKRMEEAPTGVDDWDYIHGYERNGEKIQGTIETDKALQEYIQKYPNDWETVKQCLGLTRQQSPHPCAFVITNEPVSNFIPMTMIGDEPCTSYTANSVEAAGGLKMDFLGLNSLDDLTGAVRLIQARAGTITGDMILNGIRVAKHHIIPVPESAGGGFADIYDLPEDQDVFRDFCEQKTETVFQFNTPLALGWLKFFDKVKGKTKNGKIIKALDSIEAISAFTALDRPGPLGYKIQTASGGEHNMLVEYSIRAAGGEPSGTIDLLQKMLPETYAVIVYQEQLEAIFRNIGDTTADQAEAFRRDIAKKQMKKVQKHKEIFMPAAIQKLGKEKAEELWASMETFGQYGFNKSHSVSYCVIAYACAFLKHHYPLEWWTSVLSNATKKEINDTFWSYCGHLIVLPEVNKSKDVFELQGNKIQAPLSLLHGIGEKAHAQLLAGAPYKDIDDFCQKIEAFKQKNGTFVRDEAGNQILDKKGKAKFRKATSALNQTIVSNLIMAGAMDSLFPSDMFPLDKLQAFAEAMDRAAGNKLGKTKVSPIYRTADAFMQYQIRKQVLPAYPEYLLPLLKLLPSLQYPQLSFQHDKPIWRYGQHQVSFRTVAEIQILDKHRPFIFIDTGIHVAVVAYVAAQRIFDVKTTNSRAVSFSLDIGGQILETVKWAKWGEHDVESQYKQNLVGSIIIAVLSKRKEEKPFVMTELTVIKPALSTGESTDETGPNHP